MERTTRKPQRLAPVLFGLALLTAVGCMQPLDTSTTEQAMDTTAPGITVASPADGTSYPSVVVVTGTVEDLTDSGAAGEVRRVRYRFSPDILPAGEAVIENGSFSFSFETGSFSGNISVELTVDDWNGNTTTTSFVLVDGNPIPSFSVQPTEDGFVATWDDVPLTESYDVLYAAGGLIPTEGQSWTTTVSDISPGGAVAGLEPGTLYSVALTANSSVENSTSTAELVIPQSQYTFTPTVTGSSTQVITWPAADGWGLFEVQRSSAPNGPFAPISGQVSTNRFSDGSAGGGTYYYRIRPALPNAPVSVSVASRNDSLPTTASTTLSVTPLSGDVSMVATAGTVALVGGGGEGQPIRPYDIGNPSAPVERSGVTPALAYTSLTVSDSLYAYTNADVDGGIDIYSIGKERAVLVGGSIDGSGNMGVQQDTDVLPRQIVDMDAAGTTITIATENGGSGAALEVRVDFPAFPAPIFSSFEVSTGADFAYTHIENGYAYYFGELIDDYWYELDSNVAGTAAEQFGVEVLGFDESFRRPEAVVDSSPQRIVAVDKEPLDDTFMSSYELTSPINPVAEQSPMFYQLTDYTTGVKPESLAVGSEYVYLLGANTDLVNDPLLTTIDQFDFRNPAAPRLTARLRPLSNAPSQIALNAEASSTELLLVVSEEADTLEILDVGGLPRFADPTTLSADSGDDVVAAGGTLITVDWSTATVRSIDSVTGSTLDTISVPVTESKGIAIHGDLVAVIGGSDALSLLRVDRETGDLSNLGVLPGAHQNAVFRGDSLYSLQGSHGIVRYRISEDTSVEDWTPLETIATSNAQDLVFTETHAYLADGNGGVRTYRIGSSGELNSGTNVFFLGGAYGIQRSENKLLVLSQNGAGFRNLSISDPDNPAVYPADPVFSLPIPASGSDGITDFTYSGSLVYAAIDGYGLVIVDLGDPERPAWIGGVARDGSERIGGLLPIGERIVFATGTALMETSID